MIHPDTELRQVNDVVGYGIFATKLIPEGTITYIQDPLEIEMDRNDQVLKDPLYKDVIEKFSFLDSKGRRIISWDLAKYVNHCCQGNTMSTGYGFEIALRDIHPGEELTDEYGLFNLEVEFPLTCSKKPCRGKVTPCDFDNHHKEWDTKVKKSLPKLLDVSQPLLKFVAPDIYKDLMTFLKTGQQYRSVYELKFDPNK